MTGWQGGGGRSWDLLAATRERLAEVDAAQAELQTLRDAHQRNRADVDARYRHAHAELLAALVPNLDPNVLQRAAWLTGYAPLTDPSLHANLQAEHARVSARIAEIEADTRFANRELLRAPRVGTLVQQLAEMESYRGPLAADLQRAEHHRLEHLLEVGYGTPEYNVPFWRTGYYADWRAGDEILERFPEKKAFADVRASVIQARDAIVVYDGRIADIRADIAAGERLEADHKTQREALATLPERYVGWVRENLGKHLADIDLSVLGERLAQAPDVDVLAKRVAGLASKLVYLDRTTQHHLDGPASQLSDVRAKLSRDVLKYTQPKKQGAVIPAEVIERRRQPLLPRFTKGIDRYKKTYTRVYVFDDYGSGRLAQDFLWWDLMTDGRIDGDFIPEVQRFHHHHPHYQYSHPRDQEDYREDDVAAAAAAASWDTGSAADAGGFAGVDPS